MGGSIVYNLFSQTDPTVHAAQRKPIAKFYSMASTVALEPHVDGVMKHFINHLERRFIDVPEKEREFDLGQWILFCE